MNPTVVLTKLAIEGAGWDDPVKAKPILDRTPVGRLGGSMLYAKLIYFSYIL